MGSTVFRNPRALSSALAALGTLQPRALGFLNTVDPLDTVSNCYVVYNLLGWSIWTVAALYNDYPFEREFNLFRFVSSISSGLHNLSISLCCATCDRESPTSVRVM